MMFSIGFGEIILILVLALVFLRPNDAPRLAKSLAKWYKELKAFYNSVNEIKTKTIKKIEDEIIKKEYAPSEDRNIENENHKESCSVEHEEIQHETERHLFTDINFFNDKTKILILGSFPVPKYTQDSLFYKMSEKERENVWYYQSKRSEFWKLIAETYSVKDKESFFENKTEKMKLFENNLIGIADVFFSCSRKDKKSSDDGGLKNIVYNDSLFNHVKTNKHLSRIVFTSKFVEIHFFKMLDKNALKYEAKAIQAFKTKGIEKKYIASNRIKHIAFGNRAFETVTLSLKRSRVKGLATNEMKKKMFSYHLRRENINASEGRTRKTSQL